MSSKRADAEKAAPARRKVRAPSARKPARRPARRAKAVKGEIEVEQPVAAPPPEPPASGARVSLDDLTLEALDPQVERSQLKALVSVRTGERLVYTERVNLDWPGGRDKFLRKAARALGAAGIATRIGEACLAELRALLRARAEESVRS